MTLRFVDSPDRYVDGNGEDIDILGVWSAIPTSIANGFQVVTPTFGSRTGDKAYFVDTNGSTGDVRANINGAALPEVFFAFAHYCDQLPAITNLQQYRLHDGTNTMVAMINVEPSGKIVVRNASETIIAESSASVITASTWQFFEVRVVFGAGTGIVQIRNEAGSSILSASGLNIPGTMEIFVPRSQTSGVAAIGRSFYFTDISIKGTDGTVNNTWYPSGGVGNYLLRPVADVAGGEWDFVARRTFDNGVGEQLDVNFDDKGFYTADAATLELGSGDFTVEGIFRWDVLPTSGAEQHLVAKWRDIVNQRSWRLYLYESGGDRYLSFETSTDGTTGTLTVVHDFPFEPVKWQKYAIAVSRNSGVSRMYIDGVRVGPAVTDTATYFNGPSPLSVGGAMNSSASIENSFTGWMDEVRLTVGVGRYPAEYTPAVAAFPRDVGGDPSFASVQLLIGWDNGLSIDQSSAGRTISVRGTANALLTDDGFFAYQSIDKPFRDDTFVEAAYLPATGTFELTANPLDTETVVIASETYTFNTTLGGAFSVLIGADEEETLDNLIAAVENASGEGTIYGTGTTANANAAADAQPGAIAKISAIVPGTAGNSLAFTTTVTGAVISGSGTLAGGVDIPGPSNFTLERLPRGITRVDSVSLFTRRSVFGVGGAQLQPGFVDSSLSISAGVDAAAPANPAWQVDIFNDNGGSPWTVVDMLGSRVRVDRTV